MSSDTPGVPGPHGSRLINLVIVHRNYSASDIRETVKRLAEIVGSSQSLGYVAFEGFSLDAGPLIDIPEARRLCKRVVDQGILPLLASSGQALATLAPGSDLPFGGMELTQCAFDIRTVVVDGVEQYTNGRTEADVKALVESVYKASASTLRTLLREPPLPKHLSGIGIEYLWVRRLNDTPE